MREDIYEALKKFLVENQDEVKQDGIVRCGDLVLIQGEVYLYCTSAPKIKGFVGLRDGNRWSNFTEAGLTYDISDVSCRVSVKL